jgi:carbamoyl-phosphate synthase large subunit
MAPIALAARTPVLLRHSTRRVPAAATHSFKSFTAATSNASARLQAQAQQLVQKRNLVSSARCLAAAATQSAPNPKAYLESGAVKPRNTVDVKKVLVIGSGGLAIGQAGEFDYSGSSLRS